MATALTDITAADWSIKLNSIGDVVEDLNDINQCINIILSTPKGSRAHEPLFGSDVWKYVDYPVNQAIPHVVREAIDALTIWEPRIKLVSVSPVISGAQITLQVEWKLNDDSTTQQTEVTINGTD